MLLKSAVSRLLSVAARRRMRIPREWADLVLDTSLSDGALRTKELLDVLGAKAGQMTQGDLAELRGVKIRQFRNHLRELNRQKIAGPYNTIEATTSRRDRWRSGKRLGDIDVAAALRADRTLVKVLGWMEKCAREGTDPFGCCGGECYGRITGEDEEYGAFRCGSAECFGLLAEAAKREPIEVAHVLGRDEAGVREITQCP